MLFRFWRFFERHQVAIGVATLVIIFGGLGGLLWHQARVTARENAVRQAQQARQNAYADAQPTGQWVIPVPKTWSGVSSLANEKQKADQDAKSEPPSPGQPGDWQPMTVAFEMQSSGPSVQQTYPWYVQRVQAMNLTHHVLTSISFPVIKGARNVVQVVSNGNALGNALKLDSTGDVTVPANIPPLSTTFVDVAYDLPSPGMLPWHFSWTTPFAVPGGIGVALSKAQLALILAPSEQFTRTPNLDGQAWRVWSSHVYLPANTTLAWTVAWDPSIPVPPQNLVKPPVPPAPHP